ncbi:MAG TPA: alpha-L-fucosidase C-terminal domain-containing protein [Candidatus Sumerlaeota bacterium]|nr:alpha-L-fucosidase C-terminal domain-containing protein [Candidatus Sumerlaeota bacterium]
MKYSILETAGQKPRVDKDGKQWAVKNVFFTFKPKEKTLFAITPGWPKNELLLEGVKATPGQTVVTLLGRDGEMKWETKGDNLVIQVPLLTVDEVPCRDAFAFKITNVE